jgi:hypothetical protein
MSGSATFTLENGHANSISALNALFDVTRTRAQVLADPAPGNLPYSTLSPGVSQYQDTMRTQGITSGAGRTTQNTNLDFNPSNVLGSWGASTDAGAFVSLPAVTGEQIGFTSMQRWTGPFTGVLLYGDFALRYVPSRAGTTVGGGLLSGLVLTSNIDFTNASWADLANASITFQDQTLSISGDLLISGGLKALDPAATAGEKFGTFSFVGSTIPEPSTAMLGALFPLSVVLRRRRSSRYSGNQITLS